MRQSFHFVGRFFACMLIVTSMSLPCGAENQVTVLNDAFGKNTLLEQDWGYSALIEFNGKRILFDTGDNAALFERNVERLHVDLTRLDMVIISHAHGDHTSGLRYVLAKNPNVPIYVPDDPYFAGTTLPAAFLTTNARPELPKEMRYFGGGVSREPKSWAAWTDSKMTIVQGPLTIAPQIRLVSLVSKKAAFLGLHEISLVLDTPKGAVVIAGCSHTGIEEIVSAAAASSQDAKEPIYMIFGGLHLLMDTPEQVERTLATLADTYHVQKMAVGHCTGELAFLRIQQRWGKNDEYAGLGETIRF